MKLFNIAYSLYIVSYGIKHSNLLYDTNNVLYSFIPIGAFASGLLLLSFIISVFCIIENWKYYTNILKLLFFVSIGVTMYKYVVHASLLIAACTLIFAGFNNNYTKTLKTAIYSTIFIVSLVCLFTSLGIIKDLTFYKEVSFLGEDIKGYSHSLGFHYFSGFSYRCMFVLLLLFMLKRKHSIISIVLYVILSYSLYLLSITRLQIIVNLAFVVLCFLQEKGIILRSSRRVWKYVSILSFPFFFVISLVLTLGSVLNSRVFDIWNYILADRLRLNLIAFEKYPINLMGNFIEVSAGEDAENYFFIDSGYIFSTLSYGVVISLILILLFSYSMYRAYVNKHYRLLIMMMVFSAANMVNEFLLSVEISPLLFYCLSQENLSHNKLLTKKYVT